MTPHTFTLSCYASSSHHISSKIDLILSSLYFYLCFRPQFSNSCIPHFLLLCNLSLSLHILLNCREVYSFVNNLLSERKRKKYTDISPLCTPDPQPRSIPKAKQAYCANKISSCNRLYFVRIFTKRSHSMPLILWFVYVLNW